MMKYILLVFVFIITLFEFGHTQGNEDRITILVTDWQSRQIVKLLLHGSTLVEQNMFLNTTGKPRGVDYDPVDRQIYWTEHDPPAIKRSEINSENVTTIVSLPSVLLPYRLAVEKELRKIFSTYFRSSHQIVSMELTGSNPTTILVSTSVNYPRAIVIHSVKRQIIWSEHGSDSMISSAEYNGLNIRRILNTSSYCDGLALDEEGDILYWSEYAGLIQSVSLDGYNRRVIYNHTTKILFDLFLLDTTLYFTARNDYVYRVSVDGGAAEAISDTKFVWPHGLYVLSDNARDCDSGFYGSGCSLSCNNRSCDDESSDCDHVTGQCIGGCKPGYQETDCSQKCSLGVTYGVNCDKSCNARHCVRSSTECDPQTGQCPDGCSLTWRGEDCTTQCPPGTFGTFCTSCGTRHCQGESDCPADGTCSQGCQDGYIGDSCTRTETNNSSVVLLLGAIAGTFVGTLLIVAVVLFCLYRHGRLQCLKPAPATVDNIQMDNIDGQQLANDAQQAVDVSRRGDTSSNIYNVLEPETRSGAKDYESIESRPYQNV